MGASLDLALLCQKAPHEILGNSNTAAPGISQNITIMTDITLDTYLSSIVMDYGCGIQVGFEWKRLYFIFKKNKFRLYLTLSNKWVLCQCV